MEPTTIKPNAADGFTVVTVISWLVAHLAEINQFLQFIALVITVITGSIALYLQCKRWLKP